MFSKLHFILYANIALFIYTLVALAQTLLAKRNIFTSTYDGVVTNVSSFFNRFLLQFTQWQNIIYIVLIIVAVLLIIKFFHIAFLLMEIAVAIVIIDWIFQYVYRQQGMTPLFQILILLVSLSSIWALSKTVSLI